ncbi:DUF930 domain-containing protein [Hoeflea poritis]|uniref:DUF930 domain-containing protein n=1 Tax=Hoeflea poritis TaxID=2993659 RepID=A0ABT4VUN6_9HYPH|nr:DUF930 domain-containing protein [Hoeflea poritis]MDA4848411.1 DUF930 domain-containing protein [Hoeflea poritis]
MLQTLKQLKQKISPGAAVSAGLHAGLLALLVFGLPDLHMEAEAPQVIQVQLVLAEPEAQNEEQLPAEPEAPELSETQETASAGEPIEELLRILRPVYEFGEEDAGTDEASDGDAPEDQEADVASPAEEPPEEPEPKEQPDEVLEAAQDEPAQDTEAVEEPEEPSETAETARPSPDGDSAVATTAMADIPRGIRAGELCATELRRQLLGTVPPHRPNLIPAYRLDEGTVIRVRKGAFRTATGWHNLRFRCEIDDAATRVVAFEFEVGSPIAPEEWAARGLPAS